MKRDDASRVRAHLLTSADVKRDMAHSQGDAVAAAAELVAAALRTGNKVMLCGNGGSASDAQHIAAEFTNRLRAEVQRPALPALALTTDTSFLTSHANDYGFETVFQRQIEALGRAGDVLVAISTTGNSENVIRAVQACRASAVRTVGLLGAGGGRLRSLVDLAIVVPSDLTQHIQETHIAVGHILCELVEDALFPALTGAATGTEVVDLPTQREGRSLQADGSGGGVPLPSIRRQPTDAPPADGEPTRR